MQSRTRPFLSALVDLNARLNVGIVYTDYQTKVGDVAAAHASIDPGTITNARCLDAVAKGEEALSEYVQAANHWSYCIRSRSYPPGPSCGAGLKGSLQPMWLNASTDLAEMKSKLDALLENRAERPSAI